MGISLNTKKATARITNHQNVATTRPNSIDSVIVYDRGPTFLEDTLRLPREPAILGSLKCGYWGHLGATLGLPWGYLRDNLGLPLGTKLFKVVRLIAGKIGLMRYLVSLYAFTIRPYYFCCSYGPEPDYCLCFGNVSQ